MYCNHSSRQDVRVFGDEIYQKCDSVFRGRLPQSEIANLMGHAEAITNGDYDVCRDALVHLMTGCSFSGNQYKQFLFYHVFENDFSSWLWFHLKLASFQFDNPPQGGSVINYRANTLPQNY